MRPPRALHKVLEPSAGGYAALTGTTECEQALQEGKDDMRILSVACAYSQ